MDLFFHALQARCRKRPILLALCTVNPYSIQISRGGGDIKVSWGNHLGLLQVCTCFFHNGHFENRNLVQVP